MKIKIKQYLIGSLICAFGIIILEYNFAFIQRGLSEKIIFFLLSDGMIYSWWYSIEVAFHFGSQKFPLGTLLLISYDGLVILFIFIIFFTGGSIVGKYFNKSIVVLGYLLYCIYSFLKIRPELWIETTPTVGEMVFFFLRNTIVLILIGLLGAKYGISFWGRLRGFLKKVDKK